MLRSELVDLPVGPLDQLLRAARVAEHRADHPGELGGVVLEQGAQVRDRRRDLGEPVVGLAVDGPRRRDEDDVGVQAGDLLEVDRLVAEHGDVGRDRLLEPGVVRHEGGDGDDLGAQRVGHRRVEPADGDDAGGLRLDRRHPQSVFDGERVGRRGGERLCGRRRG